MDRGLYVFSEHKLDASIAKHAKYAARTLVLCLTGILDNNARCKTSNPITRGLVYRIRNSKSTHFAVMRDTVYVAQMRIRPIQSPISTDKPPCAQFK